LQNLPLLFCFHQRKAKARGLIKGGLMPRRKSSLKRKRADKKRHLRNLRVKQALKKTLKQFQKLLAAKNLEEAKKTLLKAYSQLDKAAKKHIIHPNTAGRKKSRLMRRLLKGSKA
jgi:small subunit ribosomal protein S20